jgi:uncharacterized protein YecA (UPF0149 family)
MLSSPPNPAELRRELFPSTQLEELFFDAIVRLSTCTHFLGAHIEKDPSFSLPDTPRQMRLLLATESKLRLAYEEYRRLKMARQLQLEDAAQASRPLLAVVASHTSRSGFRSQPKPAAPPTTFDREIAQLEQHTTRLEAGFAAACVEVRRDPVFGAPKAPGRNAPCPCNSGRKYKHCCLNGTPAVRQAAA